MAINVFLYPEEPTDIYAYQGVDVQYAMTIFESADSSAALDISGFTFVVNFYRTLGTTKLGTGTVTNNNGVTAGQIVIALQDTDLGEHSMNTVGAYDIIGTDTDGLTDVYAWGTFNVKDNPAA